MGKRITGRALGPMVAEACGVDPTNLSYVELIIDPGEPVALRFEILVTEEHLAALGIVLPDAS